MPGGLGSGGCGNAGAMNDQQFNTDTSAQEAERFTEPSAGPVPTESESDAAERAADEVDVERVQDHYTDAVEKGKHVEGEGDVVPTPGDS